MKRHAILIFISATAILSAPLASRVHEIPVENGPPIIFEKNPFSDLTVIHLLVRGGKKAELPSQSGLAYLTTRLAIEVHDAVLQQKMVEMGSRFDFQVENDYCLITVRSLSPFLLETLEIFTGMFTNPLFSGLRINRIKQHARHLQKTELDQDTGLLKITLLNTFFQTPGNTGSVYGDEDSLNRIGRKEIDDFFRTHFCLNNMCISLSSNLERTEIFGILSDTVARIPRGKRVVFQRQKILKPAEKALFFPRERKQVTVSFSFCTPELKPENFSKTFLLENLLGKGVGSVLWRLREDEKLAYLIQADTIQLKDAGILTVYLKTTPDKRQQALEKLKETLGNLAEKDFSPVELSVHQNHARADFFRFNESKEKYTLTLALFELLGPGYRYAEKLPAAIGQISAEEFNAFKRKILHPDNRIEISIGAENQANHRR